MSQPTSGDEPVIAVLQPITNEPVIGGVSAPNRTSENATEVPDLKTTQPVSVVDEKIAVSNDDGLEKTRAAESIEALPHVALKDSTFAVMDDADAPKNEDLSVVESTDVVENMTHVTNGDDGTKPDPIVAEPLPQKGELEFNTVEASTVPTETIVDDNIPPDTVAAAPDQSEHYLESTNDALSASAGNKQLSEELVEKDEPTLAEEEPPTKPESVQLAIDDHDLKEETVGAGVELPKEESSAIPAPLDAETSRVPDVTENVLVPEMAEEAAGQGSVVDASDDQVGVPEKVDIIEESRAEEVAKVEIVLEEEASSPVAQPVEAPEEMSTAPTEASEVEVAEVPATVNPTVEEVKEEPQPEEPATQAVEAAETHPAMEPPAVPEGAPVTTEDPSPTMEPVESVNPQDVAKVKVESALEVQERVPAPSEAHDPVEADVKERSTDTIETPEVAEPPAPAPVLLPAAEEVSPAVEEPVPEEKAPATIPEPVVEAEREVPIAHEESITADDDVEPSIEEPSADHEPASSEVVDAVDESTASIADAPEEPTVVVEEISAPTRVVESVDHIVEEPLQTVTSSEIPVMNEAPASDPDPVVPASPPVVALVPSSLEDGPLEAPAVVEEEPTQHVEVAEIITESLPTVEVEQIQAASVPEDASVDVPPQAIEEVAAGPIEPPVAAPTERLQAQVVEEEVSQETSVEPSTEPEEEVQELQTPAPVDAPVSVPSVDSLAAPVSADEIQEEKHDPSEEEEKEIAVGQDEAAEVLEESGAQELKVITTPPDEVSDSDPLATDVRPATPPLKVDTEIERPKSPWTPSFQVTTIGRSVSSESEVVDDTQEDSLKVEDGRQEQEQHEGAPILLNVSDTSTLHADTKHEAASSDNTTHEAALNASAATVALEVPRPWTPSYSVHSQGSPIHESVDLEEEQVVDESALSDEQKPAEPTVHDGAQLSAVDQAQTEKVSQSDIASVHEPIPDTVNEPRVALPNPWTSSFSVHSQGAPIETPNEVEPPVVVTITDATEEEPSQVPVEVPNAEHVELPTAVPSELSDPVPSVDENVAKAPEAEWTPLYSPHSQEASLDEPAQIEEVQTTEDDRTQAAPAVVPEITKDAPAEADEKLAVAPSGTWTPSYSVHSQGTPLQTPVEADDEPVTELALDAKPADEADDETDEVVAAPTEPPAVVADVSDVKAAPSNTEAPSALDVAWTPSYSTHTQGTPLQTPVELAEDEPSADDVLDDSEPVDAGASAMPAVFANIGVKKEFSADSAVETQWTPSYSVHSQGSDNEQPTTDSPSLDSQLTDAVVENPQPLAAPAPVTPLELKSSEPVVTTLDAPRPWTPSYSIHSQGSPLQKPVDIEAENPVTESLSLSPQPETRESEQSLLQLTNNSAAFEVAPETDREALEAPRPWTPSYSIHSQGSPQTQPVGLADEQSVEAPPQPVTVEQVLLSVPAVRAASEITSTAKIVTEGLTRQQPLLVVEDADSGVSTPLEEVAVDIKPSEPVVPPAPLDLVQERSQSPSWVPSYSVSQQGSPAPVHEELPAEEAAPPSPAWVPSYSVSRQGSPAPVHAALPEEPELLEAVKAAEDESQDANQAVPSGSNIIVTPSPLTTLMTEAAASRESLRDRPVTPKKEPESRPKSPWTPSYSVTQNASEHPLDKFEPLPPTLDPPSVVVSEHNHNGRELSEPSTLVGEEQKHVRGGTSRSTLAYPRSVPVDDDDVDDDVPPLDTTQIIYRPRLGSSASSRFFPGGWFSTPAKIVDEGRTSLDVAQGEFVASKPTSPIEPINATINHVGEEDSEAPPKKPRGCIIM